MRKRFSWIYLVLAGLLALGLVTGCDQLKTDDENSGTDLGVAIPDALQGTWTLFAAQDGGVGNVVDISSYVSFKITYEAQTFTLVSDGETTTGAAGFKSGADGDFLVMLDDGTQDPYQIEVLAYDDNLAQIWMDDSGTQQLWVMAHNFNVIAGVVTDDSGAPLTGVTVTATESFGSGTGSAMTGDLGVYAIGGLSTAAYDVDVAKDGYTASTEITSTSGLEPTFVSFSMTAGGGGGGTTSGVMNISLGWGTNSYDYDLRMSTPTINGVDYTVYYSDPGSLTSAPYAFHNGDETDGPGPEIINIAQFVTGTYHVYAKAWDATFDSGPCTATFTDDQGNVLQTVTPPAGTSSYWYIADIDGDTGAITVVNTISSSAPSSIQPDRSKVSSLR